MKSTKLLLTDKEIIMKKLQIKIPLLLPEVPDEKDQCVQKLIRQLRTKEGLEKVHVEQTKKIMASRGSLHYGPRVVSIDRIQSLAEQTGAEITQKFGHKTHRSGRHSPYTPCPAD